MRFLDSMGDLTDITGFLIFHDEHQITIEPSNAPARTIPRDRIRAARRIPPQPVRPVSSIDKVQRLAARSWPGLEQVRLGGWLLRSGAGFTRRANSALALGDPGMPIDRAVSEACAFYRDRGLPPTLQLAHPATEFPQSADLDGQVKDWTIESPTLFMVADLRRLVLPDADLQVSLFPQPDADWLATHRDGQPLTDQQLAVLTAAPATFAVLHHDGAPAAIARLAPTDNWVGLTSVEVRPSSRGNGLGRAMTVAMLRHALTLGARYCHLQVEPDNHRALRLYSSLGFTRHHQYHYRVLR